MSVIVAAAAAVAVASLGCTFGHCRHHMKLTGGCVGAHTHSRTPGSGEGVRVAETPKKTANADRFTIARAEAVAR
ncbi:hypothetical protein N7481_007604 [Penicillium waksmanii]|uniref:uncharacterized protein n=1 Tax=Penicillium waksmanii TaxID=69791 RepID=UPI0025472A69|nr:uncharacterized protein N7481_007604 [Penicillium waksmanii]KAJ5980306.1 hypothetical protein N7481_007604 [Penicillium waksmanii]